MHLYELDRIKKDDIIKFTHGGIEGSFVVGKVITPPLRCEVDHDWMMTVEVLDNGGVKDLQGTMAFFGLESESFVLVPCNKFDTQYLDLCKRILSEGEWVYHKRSGKRRLTVINETFKYNVGEGEFPLDTTRKSFWKAAVAEMTGYLKGYTNANDFAALGAPTWLANANENKAWLSNPNRTGDGDMGMAYRFREYEVATFTGDYYNWEGKEIDQYKDIVGKLKQREDNGRLIMSAWHPFFEDIACLPACMHTHTFSLVGDTLHLTSDQRSVDVPLGLNFNMVQCYFLLAITAQITGLKAGIATHNMVNCHIYEDQVDLMKEQVKRTPFSYPKFKMDESIKTLDDLEGLTSLDNFGVTGYHYHEAIKYPFTV